MEWKPKIYQSYTSKIELKEGTHPTYQQLYCVGKRSQEVLHEHIVKQREASVDKPFQSKLAGPIVLVPRKDGTFRFCLDYRHLNAAAILDTYPLPCMDNCIDTLGDVDMFTALDAL